MLRALLVLGLSLTPLPPRADRTVYDAAGVIAQEDEARLEAQNLELFEKARVALVVLTVPRLEGETIEELAVRAGQTWGVGLEGKDEGLVVAFARDDRTIFVATGYGAEGYLPDARVGRLIDQHALPYLREDRFSEGLVRLGHALASVAAAEHGVTLTGTPPPPERRTTGDAPGGSIIGLLMMLLFLYLAWRRPGLFLLGSMLGGPRRGGWSGGFGGGGGFGGFGGGGFGGGGAGRSF